MTGTLALVGGREWTDGCTFDRDLLERSGGSEVLVLPTGSAYERPDRLVEQARTWFAALGATVTELPVLARPDAMDADLAEQARAASFIYLAGASAQHTRSVLKDSPLFDALVEAYRGGAVLAGTNAGADVLCDPMVDFRGGAFTVGLGVVTNMAVIPRADTWSPEKIHRTVALAPEGVALAALPEATALLRAADGTWTAAGVGSVEVHLDGRLVGLSELP